MTQKRHTDVQLKWFKAGYRTIASCLKEELDAMEDNSKGRARLKWRVAYNLYAGCNYEEAMPLLEEVSTIDERKLKKDSSIKSFVHQTTGRCAVALFHVTNEHHHLELAYTHYQQAVESMVINLFTMFQLPLLLLEFGRVLEEYGAFEAANDVYTRILSSFPNFRGYFDALYRSAIVSRHLAALISDPDVKEQSLNKSIDMLQFLLEALPANISEVQIVLLYGRSLEISSNPQIRIRAHSIYHSLHELCLQHNMGDADTISDPTVWLGTPRVWLRLAEQIERAGEPLVAKDGYEKFMELTQKQAAMSYTFETREVAAHLDIDTCLKLARSSAQYQNYDQAVHYAELGLQIDRYNLELREYLGKWSKTHAVTMSSEVSAVRSILSIWKGRCWTQGFRQRLKVKVVEEFEAQYAKNRWDPDAREGLAYYAKNKYRNQFMFEEACAVRIQRFVRERKKQSVWTEASRQHHYTIASEIYRRFQRYPWSSEVRAELIAEASHRLAPRPPHPMHQAVEQINKQNAAVFCIERGAKAFFVRRTLEWKIQQTRKQQEERIYRAAVFVQCIARKLIACARVARLYSNRELYICAAIVIQRFIRKRKRTFFRIVNWKREQIAARKQWAMGVLTARLPRLVIQFLMLHKVREVIVQRKAKEEEVRQKVLAERAMVEGASKLIANFHKTKHRKFVSKFARSAAEQRRNADYSFGALDVVNKCLEDETTHYRVPGIAVHDNKFVRVTQQKMMFCSGRRLRASAGRGGGEGGKGGDGASGSSTKSGAGTGRGTGSAGGSSPAASSSRTSSAGFSSIRSTSTSNNATPTAAARTKPLPTNTGSGATTTVATSTAMVGTSPTGRAVASIPTTASATNTNTGNPTRGPPEAAGFSMADCLMLGMVLRSPACAIHTLVFFNLTEDTKNACYEEDLLQSIRKNTSLRAIYILGGEWREAFLQGLIKISRVDNPRVSTLVIEKVGKVGVYIDKMAVEVGRMMMDYFNYSIPGLQELTLHGCQMSNADVKLIAEGIAVNTSITKLCLSLNLIDDEGFLDVFKALGRNRKSKIVGLDFSYNMIGGSKEMRSLFLMYEPPNLDNQLVLNLMYNRFLEYYHPNNDLSRIGSTSPMAIIYTAEDMVALQFQNHKISSRQSHEVEAAARRGEVHPAAASSSGGQHVSASGKLKRAPPPMSSKKKLLNNIRGISSKSSAAAASDTASSPTHAASSGSGTTDSKTGNTLEYIPTVDEILLNKARKLRKQSATGSNSTGGGAAMYGGRNSPSPPLLGAAGAPLGVQGVGGRTSPTMLTSNATSSTSSPTAILSPIAGRNNNNINTPPINALRKGSLVPYKSPVRSNNSGGGGGGAFSEYGGAAVKLPRSQTTAGKFM